MPRDFSTCAGKQLTSSGLVTASGKAGVLIGYCIKIGSTDTSVEFRDGGSGGTIKWEDGWDGQVVAGNVYVNHVFSVPLLFSSDLYVVIAGTGAEVTLAYVEIGD